MAMNWNLKSRMAARKAEAEKINARRGDNAMTWRDITWRDITWRGEIIPSADHSWGQSKQYGALLWAERVFDDLPGVRRVIDGDKLTRDRISGYYCDNDQSETIEPRVVLFKFHKRVIVAPAYSYSDSDCRAVLWGERVELPTVEAFDDRGDDTGELEDAIRTAGYRAHQIAEHMAEESRGARAQDDAAQRINDLGDEIADTRSTLRGLIHELRAARDLTPAICSALRARVRQLMSQISTARKEIKNLRNNPWGLYGND